MTLGQRIRKLREARRWNQTTFARRADMHQPTLNKIEADTRMPSILLVKKMATALGVGLDELVGDALDDLASEPIGGREVPDDPIPSNEDASRQLDDLQKRLALIEVETSQILPLAGQVAALHELMRHLVDAVALKPPQRRLLREKIAAANEHQR